MQFFERITQVSKATQDKLDATGRDIMLPPETSIEYIHTCNTLITGFGRMIERRIIKRT
jgi:hypothetical protein